MAKAAAKNAVKIGPLRRVLDAATGAKLSFGDPVVHGDRTVIPVARVRGIGGWGWGHDGDGADGGGGGGWLDARPVGFVEITPGGTSYQRIPQDRLAQVLRAGTAVAALVALTYRRL